MYDPLDRDILSVGAGSIYLDPSVVASVGCHKAYPSLGFEVELDA